MQRLNDSIKFISWFAITKDLMVRDLSIFVAVVARLVVVNYCTEIHANAPRIIIAQINEKYKAIIYINK